MRKYLLLAFLISAVCQAQLPSYTDPGFIPSSIWNSYYKKVDDMVLQQDGKLIIAATNEVNGWTRTIERLNTNGSTDPTFTISSSTNFGQFRCPIVLQPDGKILVGNKFMVSGILKSMVRLNSNGTIDTTFSFPSSLDDSQVNCIALLPDGKILVGGSFTQSVIRLNADGSLDTTFYDLTSFQIEPFELLVLPDGKIMIAGDIYMPNSDDSWSNDLIKLNIDGSIDTSFDMGGWGPGGLNGFTASLALQADGKILVGGFFNTFNDISSSGIARIYQDGTFDNTFQSPLPWNNSTIYSILVRPNGNIMIGGNFYASPRKYIAMLLPDGSYSSSFYSDQFNSNLGININEATQYSAVRRILQQPDGMILHCGDYGNLGGIKRNLIRLLGTDSYLVNGYTRLDMQNNGCNAEDAGFSFLKYKLLNGTNESFYYSNFEGQHGVMLKTGTSVITPILNNPAWFSVSPASITLNMPSSSNYYNQNFCVTPVGIHHDVETTVIPIGVAVPGFESVYKVKVKNNGNQIESGAVSFEFDDTKSDLIGSLPVATTSNSGEVIWNFNGLQPMSELEYVVNLELNAPTDVPALNGNDILLFSAQATVTADEIAVNNEATLTQIVVNSFDPNDKTCLNGDFILPSEVGDYLYYRIRFENTGTWPAQNITITDVIDTEKFDIESLSPLDGSHPFTTRIIQGNQVEFMFRNINLPFADDSNDGYVIFKIRSKTSLLEGAVLTNTASIYFDYNYPIITNTSIVTVETPLNVNSNIRTQFTIYPVPVNDFLFISNPKQILITSIEVQNLLGQTVLNKKMSDNEEGINVASLAKGSYVLQIITTNGLYVTKFVKM